MKKLLTLVLSIVLFSTTIFWSSCSKTDEGGWTNDEKESYDQVINLQDEIGDNLDDWFQTMDSLDAIDKAYNEFVNSDNVSSATINSQGIAVQYTNGIRGGLLLNPEDDNSGIEENEPFENLMNKSGNGLKSLVNKRKMILINPHYWERSYYTDQIKRIDEISLAKVNMTLPTFYKNEEATIDRFTELSGYGIIQIYSHGLAWPKRENITDVYLLTGEVVNEATSKKYWDELKTGNIPIVKTLYHPDLRKNVYLISEQFVANYNDFSKDTILFYGGFCYSFLGNWPDIIDEFADGAYTGHDWRVYTHKNANWCVNSLFALSDTTAEQPITLNDWFNNTEIPKSYWNEYDQRTVHLMYAGDGNLKLWDDVSVRLIPLSSDGAPVSVPGEAGTAYPFRCEVVTSVSDLEFIWDIGDGSTPISASNEVNITWSDNGNYVLKVEVKDKSNGNSIGSAKVNVTIGDTEVRLITLSTDGAPVSVPGEAGTPYPFRCEVVTSVSDLEFIWDIGDGSTPVSASNEVNITWSEEGQYELKVDVRDKNNGNIIGTDKVNVTIGDSGEEELIDFVKKCTYVSMCFGPESAFIWEEGKTMAIRKDPGDLEWEYAPIVWNGLNFSATFVTDNNSTQTINGSVSSDGYMVSAVGEQEGTQEGGTFWTFTYNLAFENYPVELPHENTIVQYHVESSLVQNYVTNFEGQMLFSNGHIVNYTGVDWENIERLYISFHWLPVTSAVKDLQSESK